MSGESDEQTETYIASLIEERRAERSDHAAIDAELRRLGVNSDGPREKAQKRPRAKAQTR